jgi:hypothetical protein
LDDAGSAAARARALFQFVDAADHHRRPSRGAGDIRLPFILQTLLA